eukprot:jgi/Picsp_1/895/NSC_04381-R1_---NA---
MVLIISFVSELVSRVFVSGDSRNSGDQNTTTMVGSLPDRRIPSAVSRSVACAFGLLLLVLNGWREPVLVSETKAAKHSVIVDTNIACRTRNAGGRIGVVAS